jgi:tRNA-specific 2-thiouridylase
MEISRHNKIIVAMSGGVDSAVTALLLLRDGFDVQGLHMTNWEDDDGYCSAAKDLQDARSVCEELGIPLHHVNFAREYRDQVFAEFLAESKAGRTPNPDVLCNREIKFGVFLNYARRLGGDLIATGHYAQVEHGKTQARLLKASDHSKDQSYFLHAVTSEALQQTLFPIGALHKADVRRLATESGLPVYAKRDSTGICFIGERPFRDFLRQFLPECPGKIETPEGQVVGEHHGLMYYTLGQRQGLGIGGLADSGGEPWFVAGKNLERNVLTVVQGREHPLLWSRGLVAEALHWIGGTPLAESGQPARCTVKTRYRQADIPCQLRAIAESVEVIFDEPQWAVTPGQYAVFYRGEECVGGGPIRDAIAMPVPAEEISIA